MPRRRSARIAEAGAVGGSIEDYDAEDGIYAIERAAERVAAACEAARRLDFPFTLTARAENHIRGNPDLDDTIARLQAYERAGADVLYAPGLRKRARRSGGLGGDVSAPQRARPAPPHDARDRRRRRTAGQRGRGAGLGRGERHGQCRDPDPRPRRLLIPHRAWPGRRVALGLTGG